MFTMEMTTWTVLSTMILFPQAVISFFIACFIVIVSFYLFQIFAVTFKHVHRIISQHIAFTFSIKLYMYHYTLDFQLISPHVFTCRMLYYQTLIDKIYLSKFTCENTPILFLPVRYNRLINKYLSGRLIYWNTCLDNISTIGIDFTLYISLSEKYLYGAVKYLVTYYHICIRLCRCFETLVLCNTHLNIGPRFNFFCYSEKLLPFT